LKMNSQASIIEYIENLTKNLVSNRGFLVQIKEK